MSDEAVVTFHFDPLQVLAVAAVVEAAEEVEVSRLTLHPADTLHGFSLHNG